MTRWAAGVEYAGTRYSGWQRQEHAPSVQAEVERALGAVADHAVDVTAAGRTDAGVHAWGQVIHFDSAAARPAHAWLFGANTQLPSDVSLSWVAPAPAGFDARRSAVARAYRYVILNARRRSGLLADRAAWIIAELDAEAMHRAGQALVGEHDFAAFRSSECQARNSRREVQALTVRRLDEFVVLDVRANAFLHHMVRNIAGVLAAVGEGEQPEDWARRVLEGRDRTRGGVTAPACGLYFVGPRYPASFEFPPPPVPSFPGHF